MWPYVDQSCEPISVHHRTKDLNRCSLIRDNISVLQYAFFKKALNLCKFTNFGSYIRKSLCILSVFGSPSQCILKHSKNDCVFWLHGKLHILHNDLCFLQKNTSKTSIQIMFLFLYSCAYVALHTPSENHHAPLLRKSSLCLCVVLLLINRFWINVLNLLWETVPTWTVWLVR